MATHSGVLAWKIPWTEEPGGLQSMWSQRDITERLSMSSMVKGCVCVCVCCVQLCNTMDCSLPGSSVHQILHAELLEWVAIPFSTGSSLSRDQTLVSCIAGRFFTF